jgi:tetratricopeptide (TPR) repeat protein
MSKSVKLAPGVRMTFSKSGIGYSAGVKGYRVTKRADGRVTRRASLPGTGMSHTRTVSRPGPAPQRRQSTVAPPAPRRLTPGFFAPKGEKSLFRAMKSNNVGAMEAVGREHPQLGLAAATLVGSHKLAGGDRVGANALLEWVLQTQRDPRADAFLQKYVTIRIQIEVVPGILAELPLDRSSIGLAVAELRQEVGDLDGAIEAAQYADLTTLAALSQSEIYAETGRYAPIVKLTERVRNEDDATAMLCVFRGIALREQGHFQAAREIFKEALKSKKRQPVVRHRALLERARTYEAQGKRAMARKDLERILAEDSSYEAVSEALADLTS